MDFMQLLLSPLGFDAVKYLNVLFFLFLFLFWGGNKFTEMSIQSTITDLRDSVDFDNHYTITHSDFDDFPKLMKDYFATVIADSSQIPKFVTLYQTGDFKTEVHAEWKPVTAKQYYTTEKPNFLWNSEMRASKYFWVNAVDSYLSGKGNMLIKLNSSITVADSWGIELDKSGLFRYISEAVFFPSSLLPNEKLQWSILDSNIAEIKFSDRENSVVAKLFFSEDNTIEKIETYDKYRALEEGYEKSLYTVYYSKYKMIDDLFIVPTHAEVEWDLKTGKFLYGKFDINKIIYE